MTDDAAAPLPPERSFPALAPRVANEFRASLLQMPLFGDENLLYQFVNLNPTESTVVGLDGRLWSDQDRELKQFHDDKTVAAGGVVAGRIVLEKGALLSLVARIGTGGIGQGEVWCRVLLTKGFTGALSFPATVIQGYLGFFSDLAWPGSPIQTMHDGKGAIRTVQFTLPASRTLELTVPSERRWRVVTGAVLFITNGVAGLRYVQLECERSGVLMYSSESLPGQGPGLSFDYSLTPSVVPPGLATFGRQALPFVPDLELFGGDILRVRGTAGPGANAGDTLSGYSVVVREWFEQS